MIFNRGNLVCKHMITSEFVGFVFLNYFVLLYTNNKIDVICIAVIVEQKLTTMLSYA